MLQRSNRARLALLGASAAALLGASGACSDDEPLPALPAKNDQLDPTNEIGRYVDAVAAAGVIHISAYDGDFGDLAYAEVAVADIDKPITWQFVDGVPDADPASPPSPDAYRRGISDAGDDVGWFTSLALDKSHQPRIAYFDATHRALKFAAATDHVWKSHTVAAPDGAAPSRAFAGRYASLSLDAGGVPSIAFMASGVPDGKGGFTAKLRVATAKSASPAGPGDWTVTDVDSSPIPCAGDTGQTLCAKSEACVATDPNDATKGSVCKATGSGCAGCAKSQACIAGACVDTLTPVAALDLPEGTGLFAQLVRLPSGLRAIAYHDRTAGDCKLATEGSPGSFTVAFVDGNSPTTDVGQFTTARATADGTVHGAYVDAVTDRLLYKAVKGGTIPAMPELVDDGIRPDGPHAVGGGAALWSDGTTLKVAYQDQQLSDLLVGTRAGGAWSHAYVKMGAAGYGFFPRLTSDDDGKLYLVQMVVDRNAAAKDDGALERVQIAAVQ